MTRIESRTNILIVSETTVVDRRQINRTYIIKVFLLRSVVSMNGQKWPLANTDILASSLSGDDYPNTIALVKIYAQPRGSLVSCTVYHEVWS